MQRQFGLVAVLLGGTAWALLGLALLTGGLDASGPVSPVVFIYPAGLSALMAIVLGAGGLMRGTQRPLAVLGILMGLAFALGFLGFIPWA